MSIVAGIDAGQSSTLAWVGDERGTVIGRGSAGPADEIGAGPESTRLRDALRGALARAFEAAGLPAGTRAQAIVAGISGYEGRVYGRDPELPAERVRLVHDTVVAHAGALGGESGVVVIAGTGSAAYGRTDDGREHFCGGWGYLFGDGGSAFWIVRQAIERAISHGDCVGVEQLLSFFDLHSLREIVRAFYVGTLGRESLAAFAPVALDAAERDTLCSCIREPALTAARELAKLAGEAAGASENARVSFTGGLMQHRWFKERTALETRARLPHATLVEPLGEPVQGALMLARALCG